MLRTPPFNSSNRLFKSHRQGFSLVEVCLALGVVSFALLALMALLPMALLLMREAASQTTCSHIVQKIRSDLVLLPPDEVGIYIGEPRYFNYEGTPVSREDGASVFVASFQPTALDYPGSEGLGTQSEPNQVVVTIARALGNASAPDPATVVFRTSFALGQP